MTVIRNLATIQQTPKIWRSAFKMLAMIIKAARKTAGTKPIKFKLNQYLYWTCHGRTPTRTRPRRYP